MFILSHMRVQSHTSQVSSPSFLLHFSGYQNNNFVPQFLSVLHVCVKINK